MVLLPKEIVRKIPELYGTETSPLEDKVALVKLFLPGTAWTWYVIEYDRNDVCFGYVEYGGQGAEFGYFSIKELRSLRTPLGLKVERDLYYKPGKITVKLV